MKVLVVRFSSIGDIVLTTPVVRCLKEQLENAEVHYCTKASFHGMLSPNKYIDKIFSFKNGLWEVLPALKRERYDYVIDLHKNIRSGKVKRFLKAESYSFPKLNFKKWMYVNFKFDVMPKVSIVQRYFEAVSPLGVKNDGKGLDHFIDKADEVGPKDIPLSHVAGYIGCVIGGSYETKKLPVEQWIKLCKEINFPLILLGGKEDKEEGDLIAATDPIKVYNACGKFSLNESASLVKFSKGVITNDTGLMHIAAAFNKNVISLWGNTTPEMGMFPYYGVDNEGGIIDVMSDIVELKGLSCRPCSKIGYHKCPKGHFKCMKNLDMNEISRIVDKKWVKSQPIK